MKTLQWMVVDPKGRLYSACNESTQYAAKQRHETDLGESWRNRYANGDRLVQVSISIIKTLP
jgi:hypothetical protein